MFISPLWKSDTWWVWNWIILWSIKIINAWTHRGIVASYDAGVEGNSGGKICSVFVNFNFWMFNLNIGCNVAQMSHRLWGLKVSWILHIIFRQFIFGINSCPWRSMLDGLSFVLFICFSLIFQMNYGQRRVCHVRGTITPTHDTCCICLQVITRPQRFSTFRECRE